MFSKYGKDFKETYGWTANVIENPKQRTFQGILDNLKDKKLKEYHYIYRIACKFVHTGAMSVFYDEELAREMIEDFYMNAVEMLIYMFMIMFVVLEVDKEDEDVIISILMVLKREIWETK